MENRALSIVKQDEAAIEQILAAEASASPHTKRAQTADVNQLLNWLMDRGGSEAELDDKSALLFLGFLSSKYRASTIDRKLATIRKYMDMVIERGGLSMHNPFSTAAFREQTKNVRRLKRETKKRKAIGVTYATLIQRISVLRATESNKVCRDSLLLLMGFIGAYRRSELCKLRWTDVEDCGDHIKVHLDYSKSNQTGEEEFKVFLKGNDPEFSIPDLLNEWRKSNHTKYLFPRMVKGGRLLDAPISENAVNDIIKTVLGDEYSGHSLRRGFIMEALSRGADLAAIQNQTGQSAITITKNYINEADKVNRNASQLF